MDRLIKESDLNKWADFLLDHSLGGINAEDIIMIKGENICWPLMSVLQDKIFTKGAIADVNIVAPDNDRGKVWGSSIAKFGSIDQINRVPEWHIDRYKNMTKYIEILGSTQPELFENQPELTAQAVMKADEPVKNIRLNKPWVLTLFPTQAFAEMEGMSLEEYTNVIVSASMVDPRLLEETEHEIYELMNKSKFIKIQTEHPGTGKLLELTMDISDRNIIKCTGKRNFPDGEVFTSPNANTVEGEIFVDLPIFQGGTTIQGIYLSFKKGIIQKYSAIKGLETLKKIIETDEGSHRLGEVALGMNNGIKKVLKHPLFVEKIGGTLHIAIGASYPECYSVDKGGDDKKLNKFIEKGLMNKSAQHVDIVTDFRSGGSGRAVFLDNIKLEIKNNIWHVPAK